MKECEMLRMIWKIWWDIDQGLLMFKIYYEKIVNPFTHHFLKKKKDTEIIIILTHLKTQ